MARSDFGGYNANTAYFVFTPHGHSMSGYGASSLRHWRHRGAAQRHPRPRASRGCGIGACSCPPAHFHGACPWSQRIIFLGGGMTHFLTLRRHVAAVEAPLASV